MSVSALCRLCLNISTNIKNLYDENGQGNGVYEIATKYFHPMFLSVEQDNPTTVICDECWRHISDFHNYQQSVFEAQRNLAEGKAIIKLKRPSEDLTKSDVSTIKKCDEDYVSLPDIEFMEEFIYDDPMTQAVCSLNNSPPQNNNGLSVKPVSDSGPETTVEQSKQYSICHNNQNENDLRQETAGEQVTKHFIQSKEDNNFQITINNLKSQITVEMIAKDSNQSKDGHSVKHKDNSKSPAIVERILKDSTKSKKCRSNNSKSQETVEKSTKHSLQHKKNYSVKHIVKSRPEISVKHITKYSPPNVLSSNAIQTDNLMKQNRKQSITEDEFINLDDDEDDDIDQGIAKIHRRSVVEMDNYISQWRDQLECEICNKKEQNFCLLQAHFRHEHPLTECYIVCCHRKLNTRFKIEEHARLHKDPNAFKCQKCGVKLTSTTSLYMHRRKCQAPSAPKYIARTSVEEIDKFIALYKPNLECDLCHKTYESFSCLKAHFRAVHEGKEFYVLCCQRKFHSRSIFKEHVWLHMDPDAFKCKICLDAYGKFRNLRIHMQLSHGIALRADQFLTVGKL